MVVIELAMEIRAPIERVFDLERCVDLHVESVGGGERAIGGVTRGLIGLDEDVTWRGRHFGLWLRHQSRITAFDRPRFFRDDMVKGLFRSFFHEHRFEPTLSGTRMADRLVFEAPLGVLGRWAERALLESHLRRLLENRNAVVRRVAESDEWRRFLTARE